MFPWIYPFQSSRVLVTHVSLSKVGSRAQSKDHAHPPTTKFEASARNNKFKVNTSTQTFEYNCSKTHFKFEKVQNKTKLTTTLLCFFVHQRTTTRTTRNSKGHTSRTKNVTHPAKVRTKRVTRAKPSIGHTHETQGQYINTNLSKRTSRLMK